MLIMALFVCLQIIDMCSAMVSGADVNCRIAMRVANTANGNGNGVNRPRTPTPDHLAHAQRTTEHTTPLHQAIKSVGYL